MFQKFPFQTLSLITVAFGYTIGVKPLFCQHPSDCTFPSDNVWDMLYTSVTTSTFSRPSVTLSNTVKSMAMTSSGLEATKPPLNVQTFGFTALASVHRSTCASLIYSADEYRKRGSALATCVPKSYSLTPQGPKGIPTTCVYKVTENGNHLF